MAQVYEFVYYLDFENLRKQLEKEMVVSGKTNTPEDISKSLETSKQLMELRRKLKHNLRCDETTFKHWLIVNAEFLKILSNEERTIIKTAYEEFESDRCAEAINNLFGILYSVDYPTFIDEHLEHYEI